MATSSAKDRSAPRIAILYQFMHPDDVVSALHMDGLAQDLAAQGWYVEALPCNRGCRDETLTYGSFEHFKGVDYKRIWRPRFRQVSMVGRLANTAWMIVAWSRLVFRGSKTRPDVVIVGTDPIFGAAIAILLRMFSPKIKIAHWCFDLHPEAAIVEGIVEEDSFVARVAKATMKQAYRSCDLIADLGLCMRKRLAVYGHETKECELTPWALIEPEEPSPTDLETRRELFGDAKLGLLYSGNFGEAHDYENLLALARELRGNPDIHFCFAVRGNRAQHLRSAVAEADTNVSFASFASIEELPKRLGSADIHLVSLKEEWSGVAVPSKFFGSIAIGRPVLYCGSPDSAIGTWVERHGIGWTFRTGEIKKMAEELSSLAVNRKALKDMQHHCFRTYKENFSRKKITHAWNIQLKRITISSK